MDITQVGIDGFKTYLEQYGNNSEMLASLVADNPKKNAVVYASLVVHLLKNALKSNDMKVYHECVSQYIKMDKDKLVVSDLAKGDSRSKEDKILLFNELITVMMKKYHKGFNYRNRDMSGVDYIMAYLKGNTKAITRDNNLRDRVEKNLSSGDITSILLSSGVKGKYLEEKLKNYVDMVMNNKTTKTVENKEALFNEMILTMMKKFYKGYDNTKPWLSGIDYIRQYLNGNIKAITRDNGLRDRVEKDLSSGDIASILLSSGVSGKNLNEQLENYINKVMLDEIIRCSCVRLGDDGITQVERFMAVNDLSLITNRIGQARELAKTMDAERMRNYLNSIGYSSVSQYYYSLEENERKEGFRRR